MQKEQYTLCLQILKFFTIWGRVILNKLNNNVKNTNAKVLHHLGEKSHNEQVEQLTRKTT